MVELCDLKGLFQPWWFYDLVILWFYTIILENRTLISYEMLGRIIRPGFSFSSFLSVQTDTNTHTQTCATFTPCSFTVIWDRQAEASRVAQRLNPDQRKGQCLKVCLKCLPIPKHKYSVFKYKTEINEDRDLNIDDDIEQINSLNRIWK